MELPDPLLDVFLDAGILGGDGKMDFPRAGDQPRALPRAAVENFARMRMSGEKRAVGECRGRRCADQEHTKQHGL